MSRRSSIGWFKMNGDGAIMVLLLFLFAMNFVLIKSFGRIQATYLKRRDEALEVLRRTGGPGKRTMSWANQSGLPLVIGSMLLFDMFFLIFTLTMSGSDISGSMVQYFLASLVLGYFIPIFLGISYARINTRHLYVYDELGIQSYSTGRNGLRKGDHLDWGGISRLKFMRTYRVPTAIGIRLKGGNGEMVLPVYLENYRMILSHLIRFASGGIGQDIQSEYGDHIDSDGNVSSSDE